MSKPLSYMPKFLFALIFFLFIIYAPISEAKETISRIRIWNRLVLARTISECPKLLSLTEIQQQIFSPRNKVIDHQWIRQGFGQPINDSAELWLGGDYVVLNSTHLVRQESRIWYQLLLKTKLKNACLKNDEVAVLFRNRIEQRFANRQPGTAYRSRHQLQFEIPILNQQCPNVYKLVLFDEIFFHWNRVVWLPRYTINQNRAFLGLNVRFCDKASFTFGYLNQYVFRQQNNHMNHIAFLIFYL